MSPEDIESLKEILLKRQAELKDTAQRSNQTARIVGLGQPTVGLLARMDANSG